MSFCNSSFWKRWITRRDFSSHWSPRFAPGHCCLPHFLQIPSRRVNWNSTLLSARGCRCLQSLFEWVAFEQRKQGFACNLQNRTWWSPPHMKHFPFCCWLERRLLGSRPFPLSLCPCFPFFGQSRAKWPASPHSQQTTPFDAAPRSPALPRMDSSPAALAPALFASDLFLRLPAAGLINALFPAALSLFSSPLYAATIWAFVQVLRRRSMSI